MMQNKAKEFGKKNSVEKIDPGTYIAAAGEPSQKKKLKHKKRNLNTKNDDQDVHVTPSIIEKVQF